MVPNVRKTMGKNRFRTTHESLIPETIRLKISEDIMIKYSPGNHGVVGDQTCWNMMKPHFLGPLRGCWIQGGWECSTPLVWLGWRICTMGMSGTPLLHLWDPMKYHGEVKLKLARFYSVFTESPIISECASICLLVFESPACNYPSMFMY